MEEEGLGGFWRFVDDVLLSPRLARVLFTTVLILQVPTYLGVAGPIVKAGDDR